MARIRASVPADAGAIPFELRYSLHPIWRDPQAILERFPDYAIPADVAPLRLRLSHTRVLRRWAIANGFESEKYPHNVDWHRLRAAGLTSGPPPERHTP